MDESTWFQLTPQERGDALRSKLQEIVELDKIETKICKHHNPKPCCTRFKLEQQALKMIAWEKKDSEKD